MSSNVENKLYCHHSKFCMLSICLEKSHLWSEHAPGFNSFEPDGLYTMQTAWASRAANTTTYTHTHRHSVTDQKAAIMVLTGYSSKLLYMNPSLHTCSKHILLVIGFYS